MGIDDTGKWWVGTDPADIEGFLRAYAAPSHAVDYFSLSQCVCGGLIFCLTADDHEGFAERACVACGHRHFICDSEEYRKEATPQKYQCVECDSDEANMEILRSHGSSVYLNISGMFPLEPYRAGLQANE